jgi:hypothetical protein
LRAFIKSPFAADPVLDAVKRRGLRMRGWRWIATVISVVLTSCVGHDPERQTDVSDGEVQALLAIAAKTEWEALGFSPLPSSGPVRMYRKTRFFPRRSDSNDAGLFVEGENGSRDWYFDRVGDSHVLVCAGETFKGPRTWQRPDLNSGRPYREFVYLSLIERQSGACGAGKERGLHAVYWGPEGIRSVKPTEILRLRAEFQRLSAPGAARDAGGV